MLLVLINESRPKLRNSAIVPAEKLTYPLGTKQEIKHFSCICSFIKYYFTHDWRELRAWLTGSKIVRPFKEQWITKLIFEAVKMNSGNFVWRLISESQHWLEIVFTKFLSYIANATVKIHLYLSKNIGKMHKILIKVSVNTDFGIN